MTKTGRKWSINCQSGSSPHAMSNDNDAQTIEGHLDKIEELETELQKLRWRNRDREKLAQWKLDQARRAADEFAYENGISHPDLLT